MSPVVATPSAPQTGKLAGTRSKYFLPYHWTRDPLSRNQIVYQGYMQIALDELAENPGRVLDVGCGDGRIAHEFVARGASVVGIDITERAVRFAELLVPEGRFVVHDVTRPFAGRLVEAEGVDHAFMIDIYEHIPPEHCADALANVRAALRPEGRLTITVPTKHLAPGRLHYRHFALEEIRGELEDAGFRIASVQGQERLGLVSAVLMSDTLQLLMHNVLFSLPLALSLRRKLYLGYVNRTTDLGRCGHLVITCERT